MSSERHRFDVYGRFHIEVVREGERWVVYRLGQGTRRIDYGISVPNDVNSERLLGVLEDLLHELATPDRALRSLNG